MNDRPYWTPISEEVLPFIAASPFDPLFCDFSSSWYWAEPSLFEALGPFPTWEKAWTSYMEHQQ